MADYQVRKWNGLYHHMALVMMAMVFMLDERMRHVEIYPLLSCADIDELLSRFLQRRDIDQQEVIRQLEYRQKQRKSAIESHTRKKELAVKLSEEPE